MKVTKYFELEELVSKSTFEKYGEKAKEFLNPKALEIIDQVREILNVPLICNNWLWNGSRQNCGYRSADCTIGATYSQHKQGNAFDFISTKMSAKEMRDKLEQNQRILKYPIRIEKWDSNGNEITWLHVDVKEAEPKIYFFKA